MHNDLKDSIKARLYDMKYTPFLASYVFAWIFFNAKTFLIFFTEKLTVTEKIDMLSYDNLFYLFPLYVALFYTLIFPIFSAGFYYVTLQYKRLMNKIKQKIQDVTPLPQEEAKELLRENAELRVEHDEKIKALNLAKSSFEAKEKELSSKNIQLEKLHKESESNLENANKQISQKIATLAKQKIETATNKKLITSLKAQIKEFENKEENTTSKDYTNFLNSEALQTAIKNAQANSRLAIKNHQKNAEEALKILKDNGTLSKAIEEAQGNVEMALNTFRNNNTLTKAIEEAQKPFRVTVKTEPLIPIKDPLDELINTLTNDEKILLNILYEDNITKNPSLVYIDYIHDAKNNNFRKVKIHTLLDSLIKKELLSLSGNYYDTTGKGREVIIRLFE